MNNNERLYFEIDTHILSSILHIQTDENNLAVNINVFKYHSDTNHPTDLGKKYYFEYSHTIEVSNKGNEITKRTSFAHRKTIMTTPDYRVIPKTEQEAIRITRSKMRFSINEIVE